MMPLLELRGVHLRYATKTSLFVSRSVPALSAVSFAMRHGEVLGIVGESGSGKSSLGRIVSGLTAPSEGQVLWEGKRVDALATNARGALRRQLQMVFQDPRASLDPRMTVGQSVAEPLSVWLPEVDSEKRVAELLDRVGLDPATAHRYPHELSGGQCQRVAIARGFVLRPKLVICDEAVSALDVSVQAQVIDLLRELRCEFGVGLMFISHNLAVVRGLSDRVLVLYLGRVVEIGTAAEVLDAPRHPYTLSLLTAVLSGDPAKRRTRKARGIPESPSSMSLSSGCAFRTCCPLAFVRCETENPMPVAVSSTRQVACHLAV